MAGELLPGFRGAPWRGAESSLTPEAQELQRTLSARSPAQIEASRDLSRAARIGSQIGSRYPHIPRPTLYAALETAGLKQGHKINGTAIIAADLADDLLRSTRRSASGGETDEWVTRQVSDGVGLVLPYLRVEQSVRGLLNPFGEKEREATVRSVTKRILFGVHCDSHLTVAGHIDAVTVSFEDSMRGSRAADPVDVARAVINDASLAASRTNNLTE